MQLGTILLGLALATQGLASPAPDSDAHGILEKRRCYGNRSECAIMYHNPCNDAAAKLDDNKVYKTSGDKTETGECVRNSPRSVGGCGVFLEGDGCTATGKEMKEARQKMKDGGCGICGLQKMNDKCTLKADYVNAVNGKC